MKRLRETLRLNLSHWHSSSWITPLSDFINTKNNLSFLYSSPLLSSPPSLTSLPHSSLLLPLLLPSSPPLFTFFLLPFYLPPLRALSWRPVVKCKHDWAPSQRGSTPISSSPALVLQSRPSCWYRWGSDEMRSKIRNQLLENVTTAFMKQKRDI